MTLPRHMPESASTRPREIYTNTLTPITPITPITVYILYILLYIIVYIFTYISCISLKLPDIHVYICYMYVYGRNTELRHVIRDDLPL